MPTLDPADGAAVSASGSTDSAAMPAADPADSAVAPAISIIVPVLNEASLLPAFLDAMQPYRGVAELILVDGGSEDATPALAAGRCDQFATSARGRARQMNRGAALARGRRLLFLHCDTRLTAPPAALANLLRGGRWGFFPVRLSGQAWGLRVVAAAMNVRSRLTAVATGDQCLFVERNLFAECGGYADLPLMEDVELCKRLRRHCPPRVAPAPVVTSSRRWEARGVCRTVLLMWCLRLAYWLGVSPQRLQHHYD